MPGEEFIPEGFFGLSKGKRKPGKHTNLLDPQKLKVHNGNNLSLDLRFMKIDKVKIIQVSCSNTHSMALTNTGSIFSWGENKHN